MPRANPLQDVHLRPNNIRTEPTSRARTMRAGLSRADDTQLGLLQNIYFAARVENRGWIIERNEEETGNAGRKWRLRGPQFHPKYAAAHRFAQRRRWRGRLFESRVHR